MPVKTLLLLLLSFHCLSQTDKLSKYEKRWAIFHPFAALKVKKIYKQAFVLYNDPNVKMKLDVFQNGGKMDAFRHVFFMAAFAQKIKIKKIRKLGVAHEKANYKQFLQSLYEEGEMADSLSSVMDLQNNELGFKAGHDNKKTTLEILKDLVIENIRLGKAVIMKRNKKGNYLDCNNQPLVITPSEKKWSIKKCLVNSDYVYAD